LALKSPSTILTNRLRPQRQRLFDLFSKPAAGSLTDSRRRRGYKSAATDKDPAPNLGDEVGSRYSRNARVWA